MTADSNVCKWVGRYLTAAVDMYKVDREIHI